MIEKIITSNSKINIMQRSLENNEKVSVFGCGFGEKIALIMENPYKSVVIVSDSSEAYQIAEKLQANNLRVVVLINAYDFDITFNNCQDLNEKLNVIASGEFDVLILTGETFAQKYPNNIYKKNICLQIGKNYEIYDLIENLISLNYKRVEVVTEKNEFSVKGDVLDIFISSYDYPLRFMFDFGELNKIKKIDLDNLKTYDIKEDFIEIYSNSFLNINKADTENSIMQTMKKSEDKNVFKEALNKLALDDYCNNLWFAVFDKTFNQLSVLKLIEEEFVIYIWDSKKVYDNSISRIKEYNSNIQDLIKQEKLTPNHKQFLINDDVLNFDNLNNAIVCFQHINNANRFFKPNKIFNFKTQFLANYFSNKKVLYMDLKSNVENNITTLMCCKTNESANSLYNELLRNSIKPELITNLQNINKGMVNILVKKYYNSYFFVDEKVCVLGIDLLFGYKKQQKQQVSINFEDVFIPSDGDFVVHKTHGIGKCLGMKKLCIGGVEKEYFVVQYKNDDKLFVPCENIDSISKYVGNDTAPTLNKMGGVEFAKVKQRVKQKVKEMAFSLVKLYSARQELKGFVYPKDDELQEAFENTFEFTETPDQLNAIKDIKADMEAGKVMDRLVCGDVGFGKTEVAMRCAFKTICAGKMVAFLCPTTILSEQHYNSCLMRMKEFGVRVEVLNRFKTPAEVNQIIEKLDRGEIDLLVGTHKLLNKNIHFKNLGLLILDEEQKFGVEDKEKIKNVKNDINILTLSATPIPRTLNMALSGIRDISVIQTPPTSRIPTEVKIIDFNESIISSAIENELSRRGQVLIIYNKVASIYDFSSKIRKLVGENVKIGVAHGQMQEKELEDEIVKLYNNETDILISTTLIENGVDLPNANTLIVIDADALGLSQLYQLKGRIGRSDRQAFAYFTFNGKKVLSENAYKRLEAIGEFTTMGSGFKIAIRDLEIRGAGNVLGAEQHGHMQKVGYAMYVELLKQAIDEEKGIKVKQTNETVVETKVPAFIPTEYIEKYEQRIMQYVNISKISTENELIKIKEDLNEVYGNLPVELENLCKIALIKNICQKLGVVKIKIFNDIKLCFNSMEDLKDVVEKLNKIGVEVVLNFEVEPIIKLEILTNTDKLSFSMNVLNKISVEN